jgi:hypothetical protein
MANVDNPNGFYLDYSMAGHAELVAGNIYKAAAAVTITRGDAVIEDAATAGKTDIALSNSGLLLGVADETHAWTAAEALVGDDVLFYPAVPWLVFNGQCSGTYALTLRYQGCDIEGATGIMEVNENAAAESVIYIIGEDPNTEIGLNSRVKFIVIRSSYYPVLGAL